jgi:hypothetical protein
MEVLIMEEIVNLIMNTGLSAVLVGYFIFKDYKFNQQILDVLGEMKEVLACLKTWHDKGGDTE